MRRFIDRARAAGADLVVFPELAICGYPPRDLLFQEGFVGSCVGAADAIGTGACAGITVVIGCPCPRGGGVTNALRVYTDNALVAQYDKRLLPTYDVFDEDRYFTPGDRAVVVVVAGVGVGLAICEDLWRGEDVGFARRYLDEPVPARALVDAGAQLIVAASASPFVLGKGARHRQLLIDYAMGLGVPVASVNQVGANDELIFDGHACVYDEHGRLIAAGPGFDESLTVVDVPAGDRAAPAVDDPRIEASSEDLVARALRMGVRDYVSKTGFARTLVSLSGGIDSAVVATIAVWALGADRVLGVTLPSRYSSAESVADAQDLADRLGIACLAVPIDGPVASVASALDPELIALGQSALGAQLPDVAEENLQARLRGTIMMTLSNRTGALLLTTGNKSELAVGYCTLYGDMNGGLAVLSDVYKTMVYRLAGHLNEHAGAIGFDRPPIPQRTIDKPPSAELAPDQLDQDTLPPYPVLDTIIERYIQGHQSPATIAQQTGFVPETVEQITAMIDRNEYKRRQLAIGLKISSIAFGSGRRMPIARGR